MVPAHLTVRSVLGDCHLEMQQAVIRQHVTTIDATVRFGSMTIFVPDGIDVRMNGINQVERWLAELQRRCLQRGVFCSLDELTTALQQWIKLWNQDARPFTWTKTPDQIIDRICRYCSRICEPAH